MSTTAQSTAQALVANESPLPHSAAVNCANRGSKIKRAGA